jgi:glycosyltransferase involved in cell wall biosynthesis
MVCKVVACIPAYNEERTIAKVVLKTMKYVDKVIVCDDGSTDLTGEIARRLGAEVIRHERNMGKGVALRDLFIRAMELNPDLVVVLDADDQHDADEIPKLIEPLKNGEADVAIGSRFVEGAKTDVPFYRRMGLKLINFLGRRLLKANVKDTQTGFRAFNAKSLAILADVDSKGFGIESEQIALALKKGLKIVEVPVTIRYKGLPKTSKKPPLLHGGEIIVTILRLVVEDRPLLCLGIPGAILMLTAIALGAYVLLLFNATRYFSIPMAMMTLGASLSGITLMVAALTLYGLNRAMRRVEKESTKNEDSNRVGH